ncbi:hypothetical protein PAESOLCIP111_03822 [Paenibacillus solanacearum]|uniref:WG repeat-containing protein n=1 Tax=Paenibacillus solanacearum TaxID=2048548 RepID=A0A916K4F0_9BACL|nr:WG repeat-containing protein [Paenibacillus solanacearum]CAG7637171.1 hypothetical protein PAESOLCIP111_03822 [Paenibacillus solanacearum]
MNLYPVPGPNGWTGYINNKGDLEIPVRILHSGGLFFENRARVGLSGTGGKKYGYYDEKGNWIIEPQFKSASNFCNGCAVVSTESEQGKRRYKFINKSGDILWEVPDGLSVHSRESNGLYPIKKDGKLAYFTCYGKQMTEFEFENAYAFKDGLGLVHLSTTNSGEYLITYIREDGSRLFEPFINFGISFFSEGHSVLGKRVRSGTNVEDSYFIFNKEGKILNPETTYSIAGPFSEGLTYVHIPKEGHPGIRYINTLGETILKPHVKYIPKNFSSGMVVVRHERYSFYGYADKTGETVIECKYKECNDFQGDLAYVIWDKDFSWVAEPYMYINRSGEVVYKMERQHVPDIGF